MFTVALLLQLLPLVLLRHLGSQDGPSHLATAKVLLGYGDPGHPIYEHLYRLDGFPSPNLATEGLLTGLVALLPPEVAEKLLAAGYLVALPLAVRYVVRRLEPGAVWLCYAAFPLANGFLFSSGFSNYCYGVVVFVLGAGWIFAERRRAGARYVLALGAWLLLAYVTHFIPAALLAMLAVVPPLAGLRRRRRTDGLGLRRVVASIGPTVLAMVPFAVLSVLFLLRPAPGESRRDNPLALLLQLPVLVKPVVALSYAEYPLAIGLGLALTGLVGLAAYRLRTAGWGLRGPSGEIAVAAGLCSLLYLVAPEGTSQGGAINARLALFPPLLALLWLARVAREAGLLPARPHSRTEDEDEDEDAPPVLAGSRRALPALGVAVPLAVAVAIAAVRWPIEVRHSEQVDAYVAAAPAVRPGSTVIGLQFESANVPKVRGFSDPTLHAASLVAVLSDGVDVGHYEAELSYFPTRFRPDTDLWRKVDPSLRGLDRTPTRVRTLVGPDGRALVDYLLVRGDPARVPPVGRAAASRIVDGLDAYRLVGTFGARTGPGTAPLRLYERR